MITLTATQQAILSATRKSVSWLFEVATSASPPTTYYWSTKSYAYSAQTYDFKIIPDSFAGVAMNRGRAEMGIQGPTDLRFAVSNKAHALTASSFAGGSVVLKFVVKSGADEAIIRSWKFSIETCTALYQRLEFDCVDFLSAILDGQYPNTPLVRDTFLSKNADQESSVCVPLPFGEAYIPLRPVYASGSLGYLIGPSSESYTITEMRTPRSWGAKSVWSAADYSFSDADILDPQSREWTIVYPKIAKSRETVASPDCTGIWQSGETFLDAAMQFSRSDTSGITDPADVIEYMLTDASDGMGLASGDLNAAAFAVASTIYTGWGLAWNGAFWKHESRETALARLLTMCHSVLDVAADLSLRPLSKTSQATITATVVIGDGDNPGFTVTASGKRNADGGYLEWQEADEAQDEFHKTLIGVATTAPVRAGTDTVQCPWVQDSQNAQRLGILHFQRKLYPSGECRFPAKMGIPGVYIAALQTDDVITIDEQNYGGTYDVLVDSLTIQRDGTCNVGCLLLNAALDDWGDLAPTALTYSEPTSSNTWQGVTSGPTVPSGMMPNEATGDLVLKAGANIILDGGAIKNNSRATDFEISEDVGVMGKGSGINLSTLITSAYESAPIQWFSEASFEEVIVTAPYSPVSKTQFYSDAFKADVTGTLTITAVLDLGDTWRLTFSGAALTENGQVGNLIDPDWVNPWYKYLSVVANGVDWVEVNGGTTLGIYYLPSVGDTFSIHGVYANTIMTWQQPYALWFTSGENAGEEQLVSTVTPVNVTTGLVTLHSVTPYYIVAGDRLKAWDARILMEYGWNNSRFILAPSSRAPDALYLYIGAGGVHPGQQWEKIIERALNGIDLCPAFGTTAKKVRVVNGNDIWPADLEVTNGVFQIKDGITAPTAEAGFVKIYVDSADGDLKVMFGDGIVKTLATDT